MKTHILPLLSLTGLIFVASCKSPGTRGVERAGEPRIVASFRSDFLPEHPKIGWRYYWNAHGPAGHHNNYVELVWNGTFYAPAESSIPAPPPARYLRLTDGGGHPGQGPSQTEFRGIDYEHTILSAFTVSDSGRYVINNSFISRTDGPKNGGVRLQVFVNDRETGAQVSCRSSERISFDRDLGFLTAGETVYVSVVPGDTDLNDYFAFDFSIGRY